MLIEVSFPQLKSREYSNLTAEIENVSSDICRRMSVLTSRLESDSFIPAAEKSNSIHTLTLIMINKVCKKIKELEEANYDFNGITVNCSTLEIAEPDFSREVKDIVRRHDIMPSHLKLEITETMTSLDMSNLKNNMQSLIEYGINFIQGYYFAKPIPAENITEYFKQQ